jgi:asparagine synthase (glutamine-hydrolysing)
MDDMAHFFAVVATHPQAHFAQQHVLNVVHQHLHQVQQTDVSTRLLVPKEKLSACTVLDADIPTSDFVTHFSESGMACFARLSGLYQGITFDVVQQQWIVFNAPFHPTPLYVCQYLNCLIVTQRLDLIALFIKPKASHRALAQWLSGRPDPNASMFDNIHLLPFAHFGHYSALPSKAYQRFAPNSTGDTTHPLVVHRFWDIDPEHSIRHAHTDDYAAHWRGILQHRINHDLHLAKHQVASQMSGGMDSTSIAALANQELDQQHLIALSHTYNNTSSCDESDLIAVMVEHLQLQHHHQIELDQFADLDFAQLYPTQLASPGIVHSPKYAQELALLASLNVDVLLTGNGGDEMAWGHSLVYADRAMNGDFTVIKEVITTAKQHHLPVVKSLLKVLIKPNLPDALLSLLGKAPAQQTQHPPWLGSQAFAQLAPLELHNPFPHQLGRQGLASRYEGVMQTATFNSMRSYESLSRQHGISVRHPFFDPQLAEFSFAIPQKLHLQHTYPKYLLRKAMHPLLPEAVCWNPHKVIFDQHFANIVRANKISLQQLLSHPGLHDLGLVDNSKVLAAFASVVDDPNGSLNVNLLYTILTQSWYQTHIAV